MPAQADDAYDAAIKDIQATMGGVPSFIAQFPKAGVPGAWAEVKALELSDGTALSPKVKALISLAVSAQIPCTYCIWSDTEKPGIRRKRRRNSGSGGDVGTDAALEHGA